MDHLQVDSSGTIESYVLGLLTPPQMDEFELHCFECSECSKLLNQTAMFLANARVVLREQLPEANPFDKKIAIPVSAETLLQRFRLSFRTAAPMFASLVFLGLYTHEALVVNPALQRELDSPSTYQSGGYFPLKGATRGDEDTITVSRNRRFVSVYFDFNPESAAESFICSLRKQTGEPVKFEVPRPLPGRPMYVHLPTRDLDNGKYLLSVREPGNPGGKPLAEYSFQLQLK